MLSLVLGSDITDASVAAIAQSYPNLELLDLSGYVSKSMCIFTDYCVYNSSMVTNAHEYIIHNDIFSLLMFSKSIFRVLSEFRSGISDSGVGMICNVFPDTLTRLLVALCPNITSSKHRVLTLK